MYISQKMINLHDIAMAKLSNEDVFELRGQDLLMSVATEKRFENTITSEVLVPNKIFDFESLYQHILKKVESKIEHDGEHGIIRAQHYEPNTKLYTFSQLPADILASQIVMKTTRDLNHLELGRMLVKSSHAVIWIIKYVESNDAELAYYCASTHQFVDGLKFAEYVSVPLDMNIVNMKVIPPFDYIPGITETIGVIPDTLAIASTLSHPRTCIIDCPQNLNPTPLSMHHLTNKMADIKYFKQYLETRYNGKFSFSLSLAILSGLFMLTNTNKSYVNLGVVGSFTNKNQFRFNNFSAFIIPLYRHKNWDKMCLLERVNDIADKIHKTSKNARGQLVGNYLATNIYCIDWYTNDLVDCLVSCAPTTHPATINGHRANLNEIDMYGSSSPLYIGWWSANDVIRTTANCRSSDIKMNNDDPDPFQISALMKVLNAM